MITVFRGGMRCSSFMASFLRSTAGAISIDVDANSEDYVSDFLRCPPSQGSLRQKGSSSPKTRSGSLMHGVTTSN
jgi:hypothetical protein